MDYYGIGDFAEGGVGGVGVGVQAICLGQAPLAQMWTEMEFQA